MHQCQENKRKYLVKGKAGKEDVASWKEETMGRVEMEHIKTNKPNGKCHAHRVTSIGSWLGEMVMAGSRKDGGMVASIDYGDGADLDCVGMLVFLGEMNGERCCR